MQIQTLTVGSLETNCYLISGNETEVVVIDPGAEEDAIRSAIGTRKVAAVLLTHGHFDHVGALNAFQNAPVYLHADDADMLLDDDYSGASAFYRTLNLLPRKIESVTDGQVLHLADLEIQVLHLPGHTAGSVGYIVEESMFSGDTLFYHGYGRTDLPGGSFYDLRHSLRKISLLGRDLTVYPGHGCVTCVYRDGGFE